MKKIFFIFIAASISGVFNPGLLLASQKALVKVEKATLYADTTLQSPVGFIRQGKMIRVGENLAVKADKVVPVIYDQKVLYIRRDDLFLEKAMPVEKGKRTRDNERVQAQFTQMQQQERVANNIWDKVLEAENRFFNPGASWTLLSQYSQDSTSMLQSTITQASFLAWFRPELAAKLGVGFIRIQQENLSFSAPLVAVGLEVRAQEQELNFDVHFSLEYIQLLSPQLRYGESHYTGSGGGTQTSLYVSKNWKKHWSYKLGLAYHYLRTSNWPEFLSVYQHYNIAITQISFSGPQVLMGILYTF